ncbi:MAG: M48 family metallopeptidase [Patescibacteria group bacterium]|nr:M48 family metallopeptidase [Patescibacteria group bacterium]
MIRNQPLRVDEILKLLGKKKFSRWDYKKHKETARALVHQRITELNTHYNFKISRVAIRDTKTRWGSCSKGGNLNFNYKILFLPPHIADYIIVHELCHLKEFNHSVNFWSLVAEVAPNHKAIRRELKRTSALYR